LAKSSENIITCNLVKRGLINIRLDAECFDNQISCNSLQESRFQNAYDPGEGESNEWDDGRIGNFYDDFQCDGANCPNRIIPGHNIDRYPISENLSREKRLTICQSSCAIGLIIVLKNRTYSKIGDVVEFDLTISNNGLSKLSNVKIKHNDIITDVVDALESHKSIIIPVIYKISESDFPGPLDMNFVVSGFSEKCDRYVYDNDSEQVNILNLSFNKSPDRKEACPGEMINYTYHIENQGSEAVENLRIFDDRIGDIKLQRTVLEPGKSINAWGEYTADYTDLPAVTNKATLIYDDPDGTTHSISSNATVPILSNCTYAIQLDKIANKRYAAAGENVSYDYNITNTGQTQLDNLTLYDDKIGDITLLKRNLIPGQSTRVNADYTISREDRDVVINKAIATGRGPAGMKVNDNDSEQVNILNLSFNKSPDREEVCVGEIINCTFSITNVGSASVTPLRLFDDIIGEISINKTPLSRGQTLVANASAKALMPGYLNNTATLEYADPSGRIAVAVAFSSLWVNADCIFFSKEASLDAASPGDIITYSFTLINRLDKQISGLVVIDDKLGPVAMNRSILEPGDRAAGTKIYAVKEEDLPGPLVNLAEYKAYDIWNRKFAGQDMAKVRLISGIPKPCGKECYSCQSILINNYANISGTGQNLQVFSGGPAMVGNTSQSISQDHNANNTESKIRSDEYH
jgi:uncharacterized repeat protein (TIGR01451 family)